MNFIDTSFNNMSLLTPPIVRRATAISAIEDPIENEILQHSLYQTPNYNPNAHTQITHQHAPRKNNKRKRDVYEEDSPCKRRLEFDDPNKKDLVK